MTNKKRYYDQENINLLELLAIDRTKLANERTFFAYLRGAISMAVAGISFITLIDNIIFTIIGLLFLPLSFIIVFVAARRYIHNNQDLNSIGKGDLKAK